MPKTYYPDIGLKIGSLEVLLLMYPLRDALHVYC
jgi:hypothetical protein